MQKSKYEVIRAGGTVAYKAVTTSKNTEEMVEIIKKRFLGLGFNFKIVQKTGGEETCVFSNMVYKGGHKPNVSVFDTYTQKVHESINDCSIKTGVSRSIISKSINYNFKKGRFIKHIEK